uniref:Uncharacterized protein n=1 Tax=Coturnix japonica TaxID=93934 RepID=A0A8C2TYE8_COTJA
MLSASWTEAPTQLRPFGASPELSSLLTLRHQFLPHSGCDFLAKFLHGRVGGSLSFKCHHDPAGSYTTKYLCRWREASCSLLVDTDGFVHESYKGRTWISSSEQDSGNYTVQRYMGSILSQSPPLVAQQQGATWRLCQVPAEPGETLAALLSRGSGLTWAWMLFP